MGIVVTLCMLLGLIFASGFQFTKRVSANTRWGVCLLVAAGGAWNLFWYGTRHVSEFWGWMAMISGVLMIACAFFIYRSAGISPFMRKARTITLILLCVCFLRYTYELYLIQGF